MATREQQQSGVLQQNKIEKGISISIVSAGGDAPNKRTISLTEFLRRFETPKQRAMVRTAVHAVCRAARG